MGHDTNSKGDQKKSGRRLLSSGGTPVWTVKSYGGYYLFITAAWAAASLAMGTLKGEQLT